MKSTIFFLFLFISLITKGQTIVTYAGIGVNGNTGDGGTATLAEISWPFATATDSRGNVYFTETLGNRIRKITPAGIISTIAGTGIGGFNGDSVAATAAELYQPYGITVDTLDNLYIADTYNNRIRKIDAISGIITTIAGNGVASFRGDGGKADTAEINGPYDLCFDFLGNLLIADFSNYRIRKVNTIGIISTVAGNGDTGFAGDGGPATAAAMWGITGLCTDVHGNLYLADRTNERVRKIDLFGIINTIAGNGVNYAAGDEGPATNASLNPERLAFDKSKNLYISDGYKANIRKIDTLGIIHAVSIDTLAGYFGDGALVATAKFQYPCGISFDPCGNLYIADDMNFRIRKVAFNPFCNPALFVNGINISPIISIYPNPTYNQLTISATNKIKWITINNLLGQEVYTHKYEGAQKAEIDVGTLPPGIYIVKVTDEDGKITVNKILKQ